MTEYASKENLLKWKENDFQIPEELNRYELALELLNNFNSTDPVLRDELSLSFLWTIVEDGMLSQTEIKQLLKLTLSEEYLFNNLGAIKDDSVFNRAFTILVIGVIIGYHADMREEEGKEILSKEEVMYAFCKVMDYLKKEKDVRGYVNEKGWAHSAAHTADAIGSLAYCKELNRDDMINLLAGIREKYTVDYYAYVNEEAERIVSAIINIMNREDMNDEDIIEWIRGFSEIKQPENYPQYHNYRENAKNLLRSLYFRCKFKGVNTIVLSEIEDVLNKINERFNNY